jgi:predicted nucleotidyltransferase
MGIEKNQLQVVGLSGALFGKARRRVLGLLFGNPQRSFSVNDVLRSAGMGSGVVQRELQRFSDAGLVTVVRQGNQKRYQANRSSPIFAELRSIAVKTFGVADVILNGLQPVTDLITCAFIYGSIAKGTDTASSDIDVLVISESLDYARLLTLLADAEQRLQRAVHPMILKAMELSRKRDEDSAFVVRVIEGPKIFLIGSERELE